jgi:hypothetical protein
MDFLGGTNMFHPIGGIKYFSVFLFLIYIALCFGCGGDSGNGNINEQTPNPVTNSGFGNPQLVEIIGYPTDSYQNVQEPFISRDGQFLFFNSGQSERNKDLLYAEWDINQTSFIFQGEIQGVNTASNLEANPTMDENFNLFYINNTAAPAWISAGVFQPEEMNLSGNTNILGPPNIQLSGTTATVNMGVEISSDGNTLYFSRAVFLNAGQPNQVISASDILFAKKIGDAFVYDETNAVMIMQNINTDEDLEYAACISEDGLEFFFTRLTSDTITDAIPDSQIMLAVRANTLEAFSVPQPVDGIPNHSKFVEAPTLYGNTLYYHQFDGGVANLYKVTRQ